MTSRPESAPETLPWRPRDAGLAVFAGLAATVLALAAVGPDPDVSELFGVVVPAQALMSLLAVAGLSRRRRDWRSALSFGVRWRDAAGVMVGVGLQIALSLVAYWLFVAVFGLDPPTQEVVDAASGAIGWTQRALVVVGVVVLGPVSEETVFRGVLLGALRGRRSNGAAVAISAAAFAGLHLLDPNALFAVPFLFVLGLVMGREVVRTARLGRAVAIHAGFNLVTVLALFAT